MSEAARTFCHTCHQVDGWIGFPPVFSQCQVLSAAGGGDHVLVQAFAFGRIDNGAFTALPGTSPRVLPVSAAW